MSVAVRVCSCVFVSTHMTSVAVHQYTYQHVGPWTQHADSSRGLLGTHRMSVAVHQYTYQHAGPWTQHAGHSCGRSWLSVSTHRRSVAVRVCPCVSVSTHRTSVAVHQYTYQHAGPWTQHTGPSRGRMSVCVRQHTQDVHVCPSAHTGRPCVSVSTHRTSVAVHQYKYQHAGHLWVSVSTQDVRVCPSAHIGHPCVSVSTHRTSVAVHQYKYQHAGHLWVSVSTQDVRVCPSAHIGHPCVSVSTHMTSVAVLVRPSEHTGRLWQSISTHISTLGFGLSMLTLPVDCSGDFGPLGLSVQYTQDVCGCPPAHTGRLWLSLCVRVCPSIHTGRPWLSINTYISTLVLGLSMLTLPVDCSGDFGPRGLSVQYTQDVRGCLSAHTGLPWLFVCVRVCPYVSISTHRTSVAVHQYTYQHAGPWTKHAGPSRGLFG
ncbi:hypothetical protein YC2023_108628 [Brassica napus]